MLLATIVFPYMYTQFTTAPVRARAARHNSTTCMYCGAKSSSSSSPQLFFGAKNAPAVPEIHLWQRANLFTHSILQYHGNSDFIHRGICPQTKVKTKFGFEKDDTHFFFQINQKLVVW